MRKLILIIMMLAIAVTAMPAYAAVQNVKVSGSINTIGLHREKFDLDDDNDDQTLGITQTTLRVDADLTDNVSATIALLNERAWEQDPDVESDTDIAVLLSYITLREMLYSPLTVVIGRQAFSFGNSFIFDTAGTNNSAPSDSGLQNIAEDLTAQTAQDAVRFILDYNPLTLSLFYSAIDASTQTIADADDSINLWGINATYELGDDMDTVVEGYLFSKKDKSDAVGTVLNQTDHIKVVGGRFSTNPLEGLNIQGELAHQGGTKVDATAAEGAGAATADVKQERDSWGMQAIVNYQVPAMEEYNPVLSYEFTKVYGAASSRLGDDWTGWDPFYENQDGGTIYNSIFNLTDLIIHTVSLSFDPMEDVHAKLSATKLWKHLTTDADTDGDVDTAVVPDTGSQDAIATDPSNGRELGVEIDGELTYDYTEDVQFGLNVGVFKPGALLEANHSAKQVLASVNVAF